MSERQMQDSKPEKAEQEVEATSSTLGGTEGEKAIREDLRWLGEQQRQFEVQREQFAVAMRRIHKEGRISSTAAKAQVRLEQAQQEGGE